VDAARPDRKAALAVDDDGGVDMCDGSRISI
jgi:hypothetical protein